MAYTWHVWTKNPWTNNTTDVLVQLQKRTQDIALNGKTLSKHFTESIDSMVTCCWKIKSFTQLLSLECAQKYQTRQNEIVKKMYCTFSFLQTSIKMRGKFEKELILNQAWTSPVFDRRSRRLHKNNCNHSSVLWSRDNGPGTGNTIPDSRPRGACTTGSMSSASCFLMNSCGWRHTHP